MDKGYVTKMRKEVALMELLLELFPTPERLRRFLHFLPLGTSVLLNLPEEGSMRHIAFEAVDELRRRGLIDVEFFDRLIEERPDYDARIKQIQSEWLIDINTWGESPRPEQEPQTHADTPAVFVSYSRRDSDFFEELATHLKVLQRKGSIRLWHEGRIRAGHEWEQVIQLQIKQANIVILLVSADLLSSDFMWEQEFKEVLKRHQRGETVIIPIIVRPCAWSDSPIASLEVLPPSGKPVSLSPDTDRVWVDVAKHINKAARRWRDVK